MLKVAKPVCFVATARSAAAKRFYGGVLGLALVEDGPFATVFQLYGSMLRVQKVQAVSAAPYTALGWEVDDIRKSVERLRKKGVRFEVYEGIGQDEFGIWTSPSGARVAWFKDPDGNILSLTQFQRSVRRTKRGGKVSTRRREATR
jgi:catechol 2,3-dioxygenase-like lactoylglutathione lyase family enzyme